MKTTWTDGEMITGTVFSELAAAAAAGEGQYGIPTLTITTTGGAPIVDKVTYITSTFKVDGSTVTGGMRGRGNSTWVLPKKPYRIKLDAAAALAGPGVAASKNWALLANYADQSIVRNAVAFEMGSRLTGLAWTPKSRPVDLVLNGVYQGLYQLTEIVKFEPARVNATAATGTTGLPLTGAYLLEIDVRLGGTHYFNTVHDNLPINLDDPDGATAAHVTYITNWINNFETVLYGTGWLDPTDGYTKYVDLNSFMDWFLINELLAGPDAGFAASCKLYKTRDATGVPGRLFMGPLWDYDLSMGLMGDSAYSSSGWWLGTTNVIGAPSTGATWMHRMQADPAFETALRARWALLMAAIGNIGTFVDAALQKVAVSRVNDALIWEDRPAWQESADQLKTWIADRVAWIDANLPGTGPPDTTAPAVPTGLASSAITATGFGLTWTASTDDTAVTSYDISTDGGTSVRTTATTNSKTVTGLTASTGYSVKVRAKDAAGNTSAYSSALSVTTIAGSGVTVPTPVSSFDFAEGAGTTATSSIGSFVLTAGDPVTWVSGGGIRRGYFAGPVGPTAAISAFSAAFEVTLDSITDGITFAQMEGSNNFSIEADRRASVYADFVTRTNTSGPQMTIGTKYTLAYTYNSSGVKAYFNGTEIISYAFTPTTNLGSAGVWLTPPEWQTSDEATIWSAKFWNVTLTPTEVAAL